MSNLLKDKYPKIFNEINISKTKEEVKNLTSYSHKKIWWKCSKNHNYQATISNRTRIGSGCPYCSNKRAGYGNDLKTQNPKLAKEWDYEKNELKPKEVHSSSSKKYWWLCKYNHSYKASIKNRTGNKFNKGTNCPFCTNQKVGYGNDLQTQNPELSKEWDYKKNKTTPDRVFPKTAKKYWWICVVGHSYTASAGHRSGGRGCPYCTLTPRSREEVYLLFELKQFFNINANDHKIKLKRVEDVDIKLANEKVVIEYDGAYWHKDKAERDKAKTKALEKAGWTVIRVREKPLKVLSRKYNVSSKTGEYKETANKVLKKLDQLGYKVKSLDKYLERKTLINKKEAEKYIDKLLKEKNKK